MHLNTLRPAAGSHRPRKRLGRGPGSGCGKTGGRGTKGQGSRSGEGKRLGFEGGQMPLQRRLPKYGFTSRKRGDCAELRLDRLARIEADTIDLAVLQAARLVSRRAKRVKVIAAGTLDKPVVLRGLAVSKGARAAIEAAGGRIED